MLTLERIWRRKYPLRILRGEDVHVVPYVGSLFPWLLLKSLMIAIFEGTNPNPEMKLQN
jgi:hypothetical protein